MRPGELVPRYGKTALVTGASSGIGAAFARRLAGAGIDVIAVSDEGPALKRLAEELESQHGVEAVAVRGDLTEKAFLARISAMAFERRTGLLVNSAGAGLMGYFVQHDYARFERLLRLDESAPLELTHGFCREWLGRAARGAVINVSSANSDFHAGIPFSAVYSASKSMVRYVTEGAHHELKPYGIDLLSVSPGPTRTAFQEKAGTNTLWFCESPESVAEKSIRALGRKASISTNPWTRAIIAAYRLVPATSNAKRRFRAYVFKNVLGKESNCTIEGIAGRRGVDADAGGSARGAPAPRRPINSR